MRSNIWVAFLVSGSTFLKLIPSSMGSSGHPLKEEEEEEEEEERKKERKN